MALHKSGEDYLETILVLHKRTGFVRSIDIATELDYSKPSVSRAMSLLKNGGFINVLTDGQILLTEKGLAKADEIYNRHLLITGFLSDALGVSELTAEEDACKIEHVISCETTEKLKIFMEKYKEGK
ncbi:MAG: metal-dependent transcriptional regulator [Clostridiales bacterium]|nr:metal-dependent transcriptional regulator [Clostridiales bacterium]